MPYVDAAAGTRIRELREARGLSPEALADDIRQMANAEGWKFGTVDAYTIRRLEGNEHHQAFVPTIRVQCVLGIYFGVPHQEIWRRANRVLLPGGSRSTHSQRAKVAA